MKQSKLHLFIENFLVYGLGGIISKIVPLLMIPIVTRIMPNSSYFGISDLSNTILSFASALAVMGMYDAMYRMFFENDEQEFKKDICSTALLITIITSIIVFLLMCTFKDVLAKYAFGDSNLVNLVYLTAIATLIGATNSIISAPTRMQNKKRIFLIMNTVSPVLSYGISIPLLLGGYYIIALPLAALISAFTQEVIFYSLNKEWFQIGRFKIEYVKPLLKIAIPLLPTFLIYWIFNSSNKLMITNLLGVSATGLYSVGSKLGYASQLIYTAFAGGWQYFAFSTMKEKNQVKSNSIIFEYLGLISFICSMFVFAFSSSIYNLLFTSEYYAGFIIAPYLFLAPLLQMLYQVMVNQFLVVKKTWPSLFILSFGAVINVMLNLFLIPLIGIEGAAIATLIGYAISDLICILILCKMKLHIITPQFISISFLMLMYVIIWRAFFSEETLFGFILALIFSFIMIKIYYKDIARAIKKKNGG